MSAAKLRDRAKQMIDDLPPERLGLAASFLGFLKDEGGHRPTAGVASRATLQQRLRQASRDVAAGRTVNWRNVRDDV